MTSQPIDPSTTPGAGGVPVEVAQLRGRVGELSQTLFAARGPVELMDTVAEIETLKSTLEALELTVVRELEATDAVKPSGWAPTQDFVTSVAGGTKGTGPAMVRLAKAVDEPVLAPVGEAMADGWLSTVKAHVIERAVEELPGDPDLCGRAVQLLLDEAKRLDATELRKVTRRLLTIVDPAGDERRDEKALDREERAAHLNRFLKITDDRAGGAWIKGRCSTEDAVTIKATLIPLAAPHPSAGPVCDPSTCVIPGCGHDARDPRDHGARMLDALTELCRKSQTAEVLPDSHGATPRVTVTMDFEDLKDRSGSGLPRPAKTSPPQHSDACAAMPRSSPSSSAAPPESSTSAACNAWSPQRSGGPWLLETSTAGSRTAPGRRSCATRITSCTGSTADPRRWTT